MLRNNASTCLVLAALGAALVGCAQRTVVRQRTPTGQQPNEVTIAPAGTAAATAAAKDNEKVVVVATPAREVMATQPAPPPAPPTEVRIASPGPEQMWVPGAYEWNRGQWEWSAGHWVRPAQPTATWEAGHWAAVPGGWQWEAGRWH